MADVEADVAAMLDSSVNITAIDEIDSEARDHFQFLQQSIGQNFVSVLNDPREEKAGWFGGGLFGEKQTENPVKLSKIPAVSTQALVDYMAHLGSGYKTWRISKRAQREGNKTAEFGMLSVPAQFFGSSLDILAQPMLFEEIMPEVQDPYTSQLLVAKLEFFQSEVDAKLFAQVKQRSPQFFDALQTFNDLKSEVVDALQGIKTLRRVVTTTQQQSVVSSLRVIHLKRRVRNQQRVLELLKNIQNLQQVHGAVERKIETGDYTTSVSDIKTVHQESRSLLRLSCVRGILEKFDEIQQESFKVIHKVLVDLLLCNAPAHPWPDSNDDNTPQQQQQHDDWHAKLEKSASPLLTQGLPLAREVLIEYRKGILEEVRRIVSDTLKRAMNLILEGPQLSEEELLKQGKMKELNVAHFGFVLEQLFEAVFFFFRRTYRVTTSMSTILSRSPMPEFHQKALQDLLTESRTSVVKRIQSRIIRMFEVRREEHASLRFPEMNQLMALSFNFLLRLQSVSGDTDASEVSLRSTLITQAKSFFKRQHEKQQQKLLEILLSERWQAEAEIDVSFQAYCDRMTDESADSIEAAKKMAIDRPGYVPFVEDEIGEGCNPRLSLCGQSYYCVSHSVLMLLRILADYEQYVFAMPFLSHDVAQRVHDLLKVYDGQTTGLILGAGARETAGIGTITVSHLAVSAQCLSFLAAFAPLFRRRLEAVLPPKSTVFLKNLERFSKEAIDHRNEFYVKILVMVKEGGSWTKEWKSDNWKKEGGAWILSLLKEVGRLLKKGGLERLLDRRQLRIVMYPILYAYFTKIKTCVNGIKGLKDNPELLRKVREDILHYKVNIENFGFSVMVSTAARDLTAASSWLPEENESLPESDEAVLALFL